MATKKQSAAPAAAKEKTVKAVKNIKITFELSKEFVENAETVAVVGEFNNWDLNKGIQLKKQKDGSYKTAVELEPGRAYQYRFIINGTQWENDPKAEAYEPTPFGVYNSVVKA